MLPARPNAHKLGGPRTFLERGEIIVTESKRNGLNNRVGRGARRLEILARDS